MFINPICKETHPLILCGRCPWCGRSVTLDCLNPHGDRAVQWNILAIIELLDEHNSCQLSFPLLSYVMTHEVVRVETIPLFKKTLDHMDRRIRWLAANVLTQRGREFRLDDAERFEIELRDNPDDAVRRILLLGFYSPRSPLFESARLARLQHIRWIVEHTPELVFPGSPDTYLEPSADGNIYYDIEQCWLKHISNNPQNSLILGNAAYYFSRSNTQLSIDLLKRALILEPNNTPWIISLIDSCRSLIANRTTNAHTESVRTTLLEIEKNMLNRVDSVSDRLRIIPDLGYLALEAGELDKAREYALEALSVASKADRSSTTTGKALHHGNLILGRISLRTGDVNAAILHLLETANCQDYASAIKILAPGLTLAKELLDCGERTAVIQYLKLCGNFWQTPDHRFDQWIYILDHGGYPAFGSDLR